MEELRTETFGTGRSDFLLLMQAFAHARHLGFRVDALRPLAIHAEAARQVGKLFRDLILASRGRDADPSPAATTCLAQLVLSGELKLTRWDDTVEQWIARVNTLVRVLPFARGRLPVTIQVQAPPTIARSKSPRA